MKGCMSKKIVSSLLSLALCVTAVPMVSLTSSAASTVTPKIATGFQHTVVLKADGTVWATGKNEFGQLGVGKTSTELEKTATFTQCVYGENGAKIKDATDIACGANHTAVIMKGGQLWQCGHNYYGQLGTGNTTNVTKFVQSKDSSGVIIKDAEAVACGGWYTAVIRKDKSTGDKTLWQCGNNEKGQLGTGNKTDVSTFVQSNDASGVIKDAEAVACGGGHTAVIRKDKDTGAKTLWQCGNNVSGQLGNGESGSSYSKSTFVQSYYKNDAEENKAIEDAEAVACGYNHTAIIRSGGRLWQCGYNEYGQLGNGEIGSSYSKSTFVQSYYKNDAEENKAIEDAEAVACGYTHTAIIRSGGRLWQCGYNEYGQLGTKTTGSKNKFEQSYDTSNNEITNVAAVSNGSSANATLILRTNANGDLELWGAGQNTNGELGLGNDNYTNPQAKFVKSAMLIEMPTILTEVGQVANRQVTGAGEFENVISVEITWGALTYNYNATWNSAEQKWNQGDWSASKSGADMITVTNNSSSAYNVSLAFTVDNAYDASSASGTKVEGSFVTTSFGNTAIGNNNTLKLTTTAANKTGIAYLKLTGMSDKITGLENDLTNKTVGTVTATLQKPSV